MIETVQHTKMLTYVWLVFSEYYRARVDRLGDFLVSGLFDYWVGLPG